MPINILQYTLTIIKSSFTILAFIIAFIVFLRVKKARKTGIDLSVFLGLGIFIFCIGLTQLLFVYYDYFRWENISISLDLYKAASVAGYCGIIGIVLLSEKMLGKTIFLFTIYSLIVTLICIIFIWTLEGIRFFSYLIAIGLVILPISFIYILIYKTKGEIRRKMIFLFLSIFSFLVFYIMTSDFIEALFPFPSEVTNMIAIVGLTITTSLAGFIFLSFETLTELGWREKVQELFIIAQNGVTLVHYSFVKRATSQDADLISAGLTGIKTILAEMMESSQNLKTVDHQDIKIFFEYGRYTTFALVAYENLNIYHSKLSLLATQFERLFQDILINWTGDVEVFLPANRLVEDIFG